MPCCGQSMPHLFPTQAAKNPVYRMLYQQHAVHTPRAVETQSARPRELPSHAVQPDTAVVGGGIASGELVHRPTSLLLMAGRSGCRRSEAHRLLMAAWLFAPA